MTSCTMIQKWNTVAWQVNNAKGLGSDSCVLPFMTYSFSAEPGRFIALNRLVSKVSVEVVKSSFVTLQVNQTNLIKTNCNLTQNCFLLPLCNPHAVTNRLFILDIIWEISNYHILYHLFSSIYSWPIYQKVHVHV